MRPSLHRSARLAPSSLSPWFLALQHEAHVWHQRQARRRGDRRGEGSFFFLGFPSSLVFRSLISPFGYSRRGLLGRGELVPPALNQTSENADQDTFILCSGRRHGSGKQSVKVATSPPLDFSPLRLLIRALWILQRIRRRASPPLFSPFLSFDASNSSFVRVRRPRTR